MIDVLLMLALIGLGLAHVARGTWYWSLLALTGMILVGTAMSYEQWVLLAQIIEAIAKALNEGG